MKLPAPFRTLKMIRLKLAVAAILLGICKAQEANFDGECVVFSVCKESDIIASVSCDSLQEVYCKRQKIPFQDNFKCGKRGNISNGISKVDLKVKPDQDGDRIKSEESADTFYGQYPWMVAIMKINDDKISFLCGGSIIDPNVILTAAHSVSGLKQNQLIVKAGVWNTSSTSEEHQDIAVSRIILHTEYNESTVANDVAILVLSESLETTNYVAPVCMPSPTQPYDQSKCVATGWGAQEFGSTDMPSVLKQVMIPLVEFSSCEAKLQSTRLGPSFKLHNSSICAGRENEDTCNGDGGGPLMCPTTADPNQFVQVGITSWGIQCGNGGVPGVYASISAVDTWIKEQVNAIEYPALYPEDIKQLKHQD